MKKPLSALLLYPVGTWLLASLAACTGPDDSADTDPGGDSNVDDSAIDDSDVGDSEVDDSDDDTDAPTSAMDVTTVANNLATISSEFVPESLDYDTPPPAADGGNPCEGYDLFSCQPVLLRLYIDMTRDFLDMTQMAVTQAGSNLTAVADGTSGTITTGDGLIHYEKTSSSVFRLLVTGIEGTPRFYIDVNGGTYHLSVDATELDDGGTGDGPGGVIETDVVYTDAENWDATVLITNMACQDQDVRAPRTMRIKVAKTASLWTGKATMYNPVWAQFDPEPTCETPDTDQTSMLLYTDFVGDDIAAKANVYMMHRDIDDLGAVDIADYSMDHLCDHFSVCGEGTDLSAYQNPFCNPAVDDEAQWADTCAEESATVSAATFGPASDWISPRPFSELSGAVPSSL